MPTIHAMTNDEIRTAAPAVLAVSKHGSASERYAFISSERVLDAMRLAGFMPVAAKQSGSRTDEARGFTKHMVRFRHADADAKQVGDCVPEVVLVNAHDRTSTYQLMAGLFRLVCLNGLVVSTGFCETLKIRHVGDVSEKVVDGSRLVMEHSVRSLEAVRDWTKLTLGTNDRMGFARAALALRFGETPPIRADQLLEARRPEDRGVDLWTTFNVIQENVLRGGLHGTVEDPTVRGGRRVVTSRAVRHISGDLSLNRKLWAIAADFAALKKAA